MAQRASAPLRLLPLVAAVEAQERAGFSGILRLLMPGEEARVFIRDGQARLCAGAASHYSLGAWLLRSEALRIGELKALNERAQAAGSRLEDLLLADGRFTPEKLRAAQNAMSHFTFADVALRTDLTIEPRPGDPPRVVDTFALDPVRAVVEYTLRWETEPPKVGGAFVRGPAFEERRAAIDRVFGAVGESVTQRLEQGPLTPPPAPGESAQAAGTVVGAASPFHRALLAAIRVGVAVPIPERVAAPEAPSGPISINVGSDRNDEPWVLVGPRVPAHEVSGLAARLRAEGLLKAPASAPFALRAPAAAETPGTAVRAIRSDRAPTGPPPPLADLPPLEADTGPGRALDLHDVLEQAVRAAADGEAEIDGELFAVHIDDPDDAPVAPRAAAPSGAAPRAPATPQRTPAPTAPRPDAVSPTRPAAAPAARPTGAPTARPAATPAARPAATPAAPASTAQRLSGPVESRPSGVVVRSSGAGTRAEPARPAVSPLLRPAPRPPANSPYRELLEFRALLGGAGPLEALGLAAGAVPSAIRAAWVARRAQHDPGRFATAPAEVVAAAREVVGALDVALADLTNRERRSAIEAAAGGISALELSSYFGADTLYREGRRAFAAADYRAAYNAFQRAAQRYPREPDHAVWAAQSLWELTQADNPAAGLSDVALSSIERHLEEALAASPSYEPALMLYGRLELERGRPALALTRYQAVLDNNPAQSEAAAAVRELSAYAKQSGRSTGSVLGSLAARLTQGLSRDKGSTEG